VKKLIGITILLFAALIGRSQFTNSLTTTVNTAVPDGTIFGITSYATNSGMIGGITNVQVALNITGGWNGDLYAYLLSPEGSIIYLLNRVGVSSADSFGYSNTGFSVTLADGYANIHGYQSGSYSLNGNGQLTGFWSPDRRIIDPQSNAADFDAAPTGLGFADLNGENPNGVWSLFVADLSGNNQSTLVDWTLTVVTVPEPQTWVLLGGGLLTFATMLRRRK
jgi:subtilisin-like proprotein convertase family protein